LSNFKVSTGQKGGCGCWFVGLPQKTQTQHSKESLTVLLAEQAVPMGEL
jgi:hypothetical protein